MPAPRGNAGSTGESSTAKGRFTMSMAEDVGTLIDKVGEHMTNAVRESHGLEVTFEKPKVIESLVRAELKRIAERDSSPAPDATPAA